MKFYLLRHGETQWNKLGKFQGFADIPLNDRGLAQARDSARAAQDWQPAAIYASSLTRTMQVAQELRQTTNAPIIPNPNLRELNLGQLEGVTGAEMRSAWPQIYETWRTNPAQVTMPNGESLTQLQQRAWQTIQEIETAHPNDTAIIVVSHNFAIRTIICALLDIPLQNFHRMSLALGALSAFESDPNGRRLTAYNCNTHLSPENR